jgi:HSP20 family molecular chaperone IbpA
MQIIKLRDEFRFPLEQTFNKFFDDFFNTKANVNVAKSNVGYPKVDMYTDKNHTRLIFSVPGLRSDDIQLEYGPGNFVTVRGRINSSYKSPEDSIYYYREIRSSSFERVLPLPENIEGEPDEATLSDGLLTLTWKNKASPQQLAKKIQIKSL